MGDQAPSCLEAIAPETEHEVRQALTTSRAYMNSLFMLEIFYKSWLCLHLPIEFANTPRLTN